jgi:CheY-like chemotaxis protein/HPt (histidine-containing phosphotransfer) domain-containing protein
VAEQEGSLLLLAEDHPVNRTVIGQQLDAVGFHVDVAEDGEAAFERFVAGRYGLVLTDLNMPRMDGYELARAIRRFERKAGRTPTPVIALSANVMQGEPQRTRDAGMDDFMAKPTTIPFMATKLRQWLPDLTWEPAPSGEKAVGVATELLTGSPAVLTEFAATVAEDLEALTGAIAAERAGDARRLAHRIKGAALIVGARSLAAAAQLVEDAAESDWPAVPGLTARLREAFAAAEA